MRSSRVVRVVGVAACAAIGLIQAPGGALAAPAGHAVPAAASHPHGFFVTGQGQVTVGNGSSALVRDSRGGEHVVTIKHDLSTNGRRGRVVYLTKQPGSSHWVTHAIRGLRGSSGRIRVEAHLSDGGRKIFAVLYECTGVFVTETSTASVRLPPPTRVTRLNTCTGQPTPSEPPIADAASLFGEGFNDILLPDPKQGNTPAIWSNHGTNRSYIPGPALPTTDGFVPAQITNVPHSAEVVVVGYGSHGSTKGIYVVTSSGFNEAWTQPTKIASLHSTTSNYTIDALTASHRATWVGLSRPVTASHPKHRLFVERGTARGWEGAFALPHSNTRDGSLRLTYNLASRHLHAAFTRVNPASKVTNSGIMTEKMHGARWTRPQFVTHWYRDYADQITFNRKGGAIIGYTQR
jgi:hypothetical protein